MSACWRGRRLVGRALVAKWRKNFIPHRPSGEPVRAKLRWNHPFLPMQFLLPDGFRRSRSAAAAFGTGAVPKSAVLMLMMTIAFASFHAPPKRINTPFLPSPTPFWQCAAFPLATHRFLIMFILAHPQSAAARVFGKVFLSPKLIRRTCCETVAATGCDGWTNPSKIAFNDANEAST